MNTFVVAFTAFIFFLSGVAALIFEALWFRQAGLAFGNSVWASALVVSSYMAGLAVGNGLAARRGDRLKNPIAVYAGLEVVIGVLGLALVLLLPSFTTVVASMLRPLMGNSALLHPARFLIAFLILLAPAIAMGATLPVLVRAVGGESRSFGQMLGLLYGANTLGAVVGAVTSEFLWTPHVGIIGAGVVAACFNLLAAALAIGVSRRAVAQRTITSEPASPHRRIGASAWLLLLAAFGSGGILLALEVVWFRILKLLLPSVHEVFACLLAVVLAGIAAGGLLSSLWLKLKSNAHQYVGAVAALSGFATLMSYAAIPAVVDHVTVWGSNYYPALFELSITLMFGVSLLSGVLFPLLGQRLRDELKADARSAGLLTLANTAGATIGPLAAGFVLLPHLGMERSIFLLAIAYAGVSILAIPREKIFPWNAQKSWSAAALLVLAVGCFQFPFGLMSGFYQEMVLSKLPRGEQLLEVREGALQTTAYTRMPYLGEDDYYRMMTDSYSMSGTGLNARRYMALYTYIPLVLHPGATDALLISFGVGTTAKSLTDTEELENIDVVDISRDVIAMSHLRFAPSEHPLNDPRVKVHIEDGRYFLNTTQRRYDLITAEPPPPHVAGIESLYSQEYFELVRSRLKEGGLVSYWLPIVNYQLEEAKATVRGFCEAFPDCTLWDAAPANWQLIGSRNAVPLDEVSIRRQWRSAKALPELKLTGFEKAEQVAALFMADASFLTEWSKDALPLVDNWPSRAPGIPKTWMKPPPHYAEMMNQFTTRKLFEESAFLRKIWPKTFREKSLPYFELQELASRQLYHIEQPRSMSLIHQVLTQTDLETLPLWMLGTDHVKSRIAKKARGKNDVTPNAAAYVVGLDALAHRQYAEAADQLERVRPDYKIRTPLRLYALCMSGRVAEAEVEARDFRGPTPPNFWNFMTYEFGIKAPDF